MSQACFRFPDLEQLLRMRQSLHRKDMAFPNLLFSSRKAHKHEWVWYHYRETRRSPLSSTLLLSKFKKCWRDGREEEKELKEGIPLCLECNAHAPPHSGRAHWTVSLFTVHTEQPEHTVWKTGRFHTMYELFIFWYLASARVLWEQE